jgi:GAF domain-containing protein
MKQAHTVKDTLEVSEKLSDVRDRIERLQTQVQFLTHDIEMSVVTIALTQESDSHALAAALQRQDRNTRVAGGIRRVAGLDRGDLH